MCPDRTQRLTSRCSGADRYTASLTRGVMRHRTLFACVLLGIALSAFAQSYALSFAAGGWSVPSADDAPAVLRQCSRPTPQGVSGFWQPSDATVETLELKLAEHLEALTGTEAPPRGVSYGREYVGFVRDGARLIYGNSFPNRGTAATGELEAIVVVCDGGSSHWGIVYDPASGQFSELEFNGVT